MSILKSCQWPRSGYLDVYVSVRIIEQWWPRAASSCAGTKRSNNSNWWSLDSSRSAWQQLNSATSGREWCVILFTIIAWFCKRIVNCRKYSNRPLLLTWYCRRWDLGAYFGKYLEIHSWPRIFPEWHSFHLWTVICGPLLFLSCLLYNDLTVFFCLYFTVRKRVMDCCWGCTSGQHLVRRRHGLH